MEKLSEAIPGARGEKRAAKIVLALGTMFGSSVRTMTNTNATKAEADDNFRLKKAADFLAHCREQENQARAALARAVEQSKRAKEKHEQLFAECEARAVARRKSGAIVNTLD